MLHIRIHRLELARHRIERDLKRLAIQHSREPRGGVFKPHSLRADRAARASGPQITTTNDISRTNEMTPQISDTPPDCEPEQHNVARPINGDHREDIIAGAVSEWVLMGLQCWRRVARHSRGGTGATFDDEERP
jgi:hypothetical protein